MSKVEKISISLTGELADVVRAAVSTGGYASSSEVIRAALRDFSEKQERKAAKLAELRALIQEGLDSGIAPHRRTADEIIADGRRRLEAMKAKV
ncbi:type II toxin-antitoxin system ParD family antitoxin [Phenylobacterium aquaticum]|uniref:type II toxin-antitoxin system ParD family antitoxin n=1 Tax=Phenylobacterium aquaticum TaxID=1763816 RepID=UPI0026EF87DE|nr:type II toxin-antitoxin system ParD family antitoxin [Phenylobacterium aquaticum]